MEAITRENLKRSAPWSYGKLKSARSRTKNVGVSELREVARVVSLGQINNIGNDGARKFKVCSQEQLQINKRLCVHEKGWNIRIARNRAKSIIRPNNYIGSDRARKFKKVCSWEQRQNKECERDREKSWTLRIARNRTSSMIRPN